MKNNASRLIGCVAVLLSLNLMAVAHPSGQTGSGGTHTGQHGNHMDRMAKALNLTPAQQTQIGDIMKSQPPGPAREAAVKAILTPDQQTQLTQMKANREANESGPGKAPASTSPPGY